MPENSVITAPSTQYNGPSKEERLNAIEANWFRLPYELWLSVLVDYDLGAADLVSLEYSAKWFSNGWGGEL